MTLWEREHLAFLRRYENGIPSHDTLCDVFAARDPELFKACLLAWVSDLRDVVAEASRSERRSGHDGCHGDTDGHCPHHP
jgi:hypothetical protein